jgi:hypothetical protein
VSLSALPLFDAMSPHPRAQVRHRAVRSPGRYRAALRVLAATAGRRALVLGERLVQMLVTTLMVGGLLGVILAMSFGIV